MQLTSRAVLAAALVLLAGTGCVSRAGGERLTPLDSNENANDGGRAPLTVEIVDDLPAVVGRGERVAVFVTVRSTAAATITAFSATFDRQPAGAVAAQLIGPLPVLDGPGVASLGLFVDVSLQAEAIDTSMRVEVSGQVGGNAETAFDAAAFRVDPGVDLSVRLARDEDDIGASAPTLEAAGGFDDLSLREALRIANALADPATVRFDPVVFSSPGIPIELEAALPTVTVDGLVIDARGTAPILDGAAVTKGDLLAVDASDVTIYGLGFANHSVVDAYALHHIGGNRLTLDGIVARNCGVVDGGRSGQVALDAGTGDRVLGSRFVGGARDGLMVRSVASEIRFNEFDDNDDDGATLEGSGHVFEDNALRGNSGEALEVEGDGHVIRANVFANTNGAGVLFSAEGASDVTIAENVFRDVTTSVRDPSSLATEITLANNQMVGAPAISIENGLSGPIFIDGNLYADDSWTPIALGGANGGLTPPLITSFDGATVTGTTEPNGTVSIYEAAVSGWSPVGSGVAAGDGSFTVELARPTGRVVAQVTTAAGSSAFGDRALSVTPLVVTTLVDELDGPPTMTSLAEAGGPNDLSLREAIVLANNVAGPDVITLSPGLAPGTIEVGSGPAGFVPLPPFLDHELTLDGDDQLTIRGGTRAWVQEPGGRGDDLISMEATLGTVRRVRLEQALGASADCLLIRSPRNTVEQVDFATCEDKAIQIENTSDVLIRDVTTRGGTYGVRVLESVGVTLLRVYAREHAEACFETNDNSGLEILDSRGERCLHGLYSFGESIVLVGNRFVDTVSSAVVLRGGTQRIVAFNTLARATTGLALDGTVTSALVRNNIFAFTSEPGIAAASTVVLTEEHNLFFDNQGDGGSGAGAITVDGAPQTTATTSVIADPLFFDAGAGDFTPGASVVDQGVDVGFDRNGAAAGNFNGAAPDIGHVEQ